MDVDECARLLQSDAGELRNMLGMSLEVANAVRSQGGRSFQDVAKALCSRFNLGIDVFDEDESRAEGLVLRHDDGTVSVHVKGLTDALEHRSIFYHELAHALLHMERTTDPRIDVLEAQAWLFGLNVVANDGLTEREKLLPYLFRLQDAIPSQYAAAFAVVLAFFQRNWKDLAVGTEDFESRARILVVNLEKLLIQRIAVNPNVMYGVSDRTFEDVIAELLRGQGWEVEQTKQTRDGGVDIIAVNSIGRSSVRFLVECK